MWKLAATVLILLQGGAATSLVSRDDSVEGPSNVFVQLEDESTVSVYWNFTEPEGFALSDLAFILTLQSTRNVTKKLLAAVHRKPCHARLSFLRPAVTYTVRVDVVCRHELKPRRLCRDGKKCGQCPSWRETSTAQKQFATLEGGYAYPSITKRNLKDTGRGVFCEIEWTYNTIMGSAAYFNVVFRNPETRSIRMAHHARRAVFPVKYHSSFSANVVAFFYKSADVLVRRSSPLIFGNVSMSKPDEIKRLTMIEYHGDQVTITWSPPAVTKGPLSYQEVILFDPRNPLLVSSANVTWGFNATLPVPEFRGDDVEIWIRAVNLEPDGKAYKGAYSKFHRKWIVPPQPHGFKILNRTDTEVRFQVFRRGGGLRAYFDFKSKAKLVPLNTWNGMAEIFDLKAFTGYMVYVRICGIFGAPEVLSCGPYAEFLVVSNVGAPSKVRSAAVVFSKRCFNASWEIPLEPRGPIDGYYISVRMGDGNSPHREYKNQTVPVPEFHNCSIRFESVRAYRLWILPFNVDMQNTSRVHFAEEMYIGYGLTPSHDPKVGFFTTIFLIYFVAIIAVIIAMNLVLPPIAHLQCLLRMCM